MGQHYTAKVQTSESQIPEKSGYFNVSVKSTNFMCIFTVEKC